MIRTMYRYLALLTSLFLVSNQSLWCATHIVTNLFDDDSIGSLRTTIATAISGDTIVFSVAGTIVLDQAKAELLIDKMLTIDGNKQITIDGGNAIPICFHITGADASESTITSIAIQNFTNPADNGQAYGILLDNNANDCSVDGCTITHIQSGKGSSAQAGGIYASVTVASTGPVTNNIITHITSEDNVTGRSGTAFGIFASFGIGTTDVSADCSNNTVSCIQSGLASNDPSGQVFGIFIFSLNGSCNDNVISELSGGDVLGISFSQEVTGIDIRTSLIGNCNNNTIKHLSNGAATNSPRVTGMRIGQPVASTIRDNTITNLHSNSASELSGEVYGIALFGEAHTTIASNTIDNVTSGPSDQNSGTVKGIYCSEHATGTCNNNTITTMTSGDANQESGSLYGIQFERGLTGTCSNNVIIALQTGAAVTQGLTTGIHSKDTIESALTTSLLECNQISALTGGQGEQGHTSGIWLQAGTQYGIRANTIQDIHACQDNCHAHGILLGGIGGNAGSAQDNHIELNTLFNISADSMQSHGVTIGNSESTGNDILNNSIFGIEKRAINTIDHSVPIDAHVILTSVRCSDGCKLIISGTILPFIMTTLSFKVQFFVSDSNIPEQTKTFVGEYIHDTTHGTRFKARCSQLPPLEPGTFITATATALTEPHHNTSKVSNALVTCTPFNNVCQCPPPQPTSPPPCPAVNC